MIHDLFCNFHKSILFFWSCHILCLSNHFLTCHNILFLTHSKYSVLSTVKNSYLSKLVLSNRHSHSISTLRRHVKLKQFHTQYQDVILSFSLCPQKPQNSLTKFQMQLVKLKDIQHALKIYYLDQNLSEHGRLDLKICEIVA